jgi:hypothetical protein
MSYPPPTISIHLAEPLTTFRETPRLSGKHSAEKHSEETTLLAKSTERSM